jgi:two-component system invasion response regulator UvrY
MPHTKTALQDTPTGSREIRTLIVDDHAVFRGALRALLAAAPGFVLAGETRSGEAAVSAVRRLNAQLVLMDVVLPGMDGIAAARAILDQDPELAVVLLSVREPDIYGGATTLGETVFLSRKQDLRPSSLGEFWARHAARARRRSGQPSGIDPTILVPSPGVE